MVPPVVIRVMERIESASYRRKTNKAPVAGALPSPMDTGGTSALDGGDADGGVALAVAGPLLEGLLGAELLDAELLAQHHGLDHLGGDGGPAHEGLADLGLTFTFAHQQDLVERELLAGLGLAGLDEVDHHHVALGNAALGPGFLD